MKKFFKFLFVIISIAAICGCAYFGYMYFKDKIGGSTITLTSADAKELAFTAAYDMGVITAVDFKDNIGKSPIDKPTNYSKNWDSPPNLVDTSNENETYSTYDDDYIYLVCDDHICEYNVPAIDRDLNNACNFFKKNITANKYYSLDGIKGYYTLEKNTLTFRFWNTDLNGAYSNYHANEYVVKYTALKKNNNGITEYLVDIKCFSADDFTISNITHNESRLYIVNLSVGKNAENNKQLNQFYASLSFVGNTIKKYSDFEDIANLSARTLTYDCNIVDNKILYFVSQDVQQLQKMVNSFSEDVHFNAPEYYADKVVTNL